jgi:quinol monooxygenase YgiN
VVEHDIAPEDTEAFVTAMQLVRRIRLRDGAFRWSLFQDTSHPTRWLETVLVESWNEYLRQHARGTQADHEIEARVRSFHRGPDDPRMAHYIASSARLKPEEPDDE